MIMIKRYCKQAWALLWQNKLYGALYLLGTAVPMVLTMIVVMYFHLLTAPIYPEHHRSQLYEVRTVNEVSPSTMGSGCCNLAMVRQWFYPLRSAEAVSAIYYYDFSIKDFLKLPDGISEMKVKSKYTDPGFFRVFDFEFLDGGPFTQADMDAGRQCVVLSSSTAHRLFGTDKAKGKNIQINDIGYTVVGVVRDVSSLTPVSFAQVWLPYSCMPNFGTFEGNEVGRGAYSVVIRTRDEAQAEQMLQEVKDLQRRYNAMQTDGRKIELYGPIAQWKRNLQPGNGEVDLAAIFRFWGALLLTFLIVPAVNLGGMISGKMELRRSEIGVSKAFGASKGYLLRQVIRENLIMTLMGGFIGLCLSWMLLGWGHDWVISLFDTYGLMQAETQEMLVSPSMLFSPVLFLIAFLFCLLLNLVSALIPAWHAMRVPIVQALGEKK